MGILKKRGRPKKEPEPLPQTPTVQAQEAGLPQFPEQQPQPPQQPVQQQQPQPVQEPTPQQKLTEEQENAKKHLEAYAREHSIVFEKGDITEIQGLIFGIYSILREIKDLLVEEVD